MVVLYGPFPLDLAVPASAARSAIASFIAESEAPAWRPTGAVVGKPGLYLLVDTAGKRPVVTGFHVIFGSSYLKIGAAGAPERAPPYVAAFLEAATEAVWWRDFPVAPITAAVWRPIVVLEWPSALAERSVCPPPGSVEPGAAHAALEAEEEGNWLLPTGDRSRNTRRSPSRVEGETADPARPGTSLSARRSLVTIVRAHLEHTAASHEGRYFLVGPDRFSGSGDTAVSGDEAPPVFAAPEAALPLETWLAVGARPAPKAESPLEQHGMGPPLVLPHGGIGYPLSGWLTRNLDVWPERPKDVHAGTLVRRDVRSDGIAQVQLAALVSALVFVPLLALSLLVQMISAPSATATPAPVTVHAQPAISVCSADHATFVREFRCQIGSMSAGTSLEVPVCGDIDSADPIGPATGNLQPDYCGLLDRTRDQPELVIGGNVAVNPAELAATQACFNVLGYPDPYRLPAAVGDGPRVYGDPVAFLDNAELAIQPLQSLVAQLEAACEGYRGRIDARVEGAVFATHVGVPSGIPADEQVATLRSRLLDDALVDETDTDARCFRAGAADALSAATYPELCGEGPPVLPPEGVGQIWTELDEPGVPGEGVIERYVTARFGSERVATGRTPSLWACHLDLAERRAQTAFAGNWDLAIPIPHAYDVNAGAIRTQLELDAALGALRTTTEAGACWSVMSDRLAHYQPVHPLLGAFDEKAHFSVEQQLCAQACAVRYHLSDATAGTWITPGADLRLCVDRTPPTGGNDAEFAFDPTLVDASPQPAFDRLQMPWNSRKNVGPVRPSIEQICSFNLLAQGLLPTPEGGLLASGAEKVAWAGETTDGSRLAGGIRGTAASAAVNLSTYGGSRSQETCADVAAQCFVSLFLDDVKQETPPARYLWPEEWARSVAAVSSRTGGGGGGAARATLTPWCEIVAPYLVPSGALPEGQLDYPCAKGVDEQRARIAAVVKAAAARGGR